MPALTIALAKRCGAASRHIIAIKDVATRHKIEIPYRITCPFDRLELHIQSTRIQLLANGKEQRRSGQYFLICFQRHEYGIGENGLIAGLVRDRVFLPRTDQEPRSVLVANSQIPIAGKEIR